MEDKEKSAEDLVAEMMNQPDAPTETNTAAPQTEAPAETATETVAAEPQAATTPETEATTETASVETPAPTVEAAPAEQPVVAPVAEAPVEAPAPVEQPAPMPEEPVAEPVAPQSAPQPMPQPMPELMSAAPAIAEQPVMAQPATEQPVAQPMAGATQPMMGQPAVGMSAPAQPAAQSDIFPDLNDINLNQASSTAIKAPSKKPIILALIAALVVIVGIVIVAIVMMNGSKKPTNSTNNGGSNTTPVVVPDDDDNDEEMTDEEKAALKAEQVAAVTEVVDQLKETVVETNSDYKITDTTEEDGTYVAFQVDGAKVAVILDEAIGFRADLDTDDPSASIDAAKATKAELEKKFDELGFEKYEKVSDREENYAYYNKDKDIACNPINSGSPIYVMCANTTWYDEDDVALANDLFDAYNKAVGEEDAKIDRIGARKAMIKDSEIAPYQTITASAPGAAALFYRVNPTSPWVFFTFAQAVRDCSEYNTDDLKAAFHGETCYNEVDGQQVEAKVE